MGGVVLETASERLIRQGRDEGIRQGRDEGIRQGRDEGIRQGRDEGIRQGRDEERIKTVQTIIKMGYKYGLDASEILTELQDNIGLSMEEAVDCLNSFAE